MRRGFSRSSWRGLPDTSVRPRSCPDHDLLPSPRVQPPPQAGTGGCPRPPPAQPVPRPRLCPCSAFRQEPRPGSPIRTSGLRPADPGWAPARPRARWGRHFPPLLGGKFLPLSSFGASSVPMPCCRPAPPGPARPAATEGAVSGDPRPRSPPGGRTFPYPRTATAPPRSSPTFSPPNGNNKVSLVEITSAGSRRDAVEERRPGLSLQGACAAR